MNEERKRLGVAAALASALINAVFLFLFAIEPWGVMGWSAATAIPLFLLAAWRFHVSGGRVIGLLAIAAGLPLLLLSLVTLVTAPIGLALALGVISATRAAWRQPR